MQLFGDLSTPSLLSINHDHDYAALRLDNSVTDEHEANLLLEYGADEHEANLPLENGIDDIINTTLSLDQNFGVLHYEIDNFEVFCKNKYSERSLSSEKKICFPAMYIVRRCQSNRLREPLH